MFHIVTLKNLTNSRRFFGVTKNPEHYIARFIRVLNDDLCTSPDLQRDWDRRHEFEFAVGKESFSTYRQALAARGAKANRDRTTYNLWYVVSARQAARFKGKMTIADCAKMFGVGKQTVARIWQQGKT